MRIEDIRELLRRYPVVKEVPHEQPEEFTRAGMVHIRFHGAMDAGMALDLFDRKPDEGHLEWLDRIEKLLLDWVNQEQVADPDVEEAVPLVRGVGYFLPRGRFKAPMWDRITEFIGMGLAIDTPDQIRLLSDNELPEDRSPENIARIRERACINLVNLSQPPLVQELPYGPDVVSFATPHAYQVSWFAHTTLLADALNHYQRTTNTPWLVIPAMRKDLLLINSVSPGWAALLDDLEPLSDDREVIHPVPHMLIDGQWREYLPPVAPELQRRLTVLKLLSEKRAHESCRDYLKEFAPQDADYVSEFQVVGKDDRFTTWAAVSCDLERTSIPRVDQVGFHVSGAQLYIVWFEHLMARLPHLVRRHEGAMPTRWIVAKPSDADLRVIAEMALQV
ncbi:MAG: hypothetical protein Q4D96_07990 [Propionibacteriaceae bacterium]|nr:hypothetical protein [Propionibacteriaceae bacterium]